jgi:catechol 2,3-dioxygenase-like lactoylglutathione lyase family enzyme
MIDHISLRVKDFEKAVAFYRAALAPIGYQVLMEFSGSAGLGAGNKPDLWIMQAEPPLHATHLAFTAERHLVDAFHAAAIAAGGTDNGAPGPRPYHEHYYGAFVFDPEGNNLEVVSHADPSAPKPEPAARRKPTASKAAPKSKVQAKAKPKAKALPKAKAKALPKAKAKALPKAKAKAAKPKAKAKVAKKRR